MNMHNVHMQHRPRALASRKLNTDPKPYYVEEVPKRYSREEITKDSRVGEWGGIISNLARERPRPEYNNSPNPILVAFREYCTDATGPQLVEAADTWIRAMLDPDDNSAARPMLEGAYGEIDESGNFHELYYKTHARNVFWRIIGMAELDTERPTPGTSEHEAMLKCALLDATPEPSKLEEVTARLEAAAAAIVEAFERSTMTGDEVREALTPPKRSYVFCGECGDIVSAEGLRVYENAEVCPACFAAIDALAAEDQERDGETIPDPREVNTKNPVHHVISQNGMSVDFLHIDGSTDDDRQRVFHALRIRRNVSTSVHITPADQAAYYQQTIGTLLRYAGVTITRQ